MTTIEDITVGISVELGCTYMPIYQLLRMGRGAVIELDTDEGDDVRLLANNIPVAKGQVILRGERVGITVTGVLHRDIEHRPLETVKKIKGKTVQTGS